MEKRIKSSIILVKNLQSLFAYMAASDRKYIDPNDVIKSIVDEQGQPIQIGDQQDIGEFMVTFLLRLDEGLQQQQEQKDNTESMDLEQKNAQGMIA